jgi:predicted RNase H-like nuclease
MDVKHTFPATDHITADRLVFDVGGNKWRIVAREAARTSVDGLHLVEVFPAIALASMSEQFFGRLMAPRYNPGRRKTYLAADWVRVTGAAALMARTLGCDEVAGWCDTVGGLRQPKKADQDMLDAVICVLIAIRWRRCSRQESIMLGDLESGYMVLPASPQVRERLTVFAGMRSVAVDGMVKR